jgi:hypothetical protein
VESLSYGILDVVRTGLDFPSSMLSRKLSLASPSESRTHKVISNGRYFVDESSLSSAHIRPIIRLPSSNINSYVLQIATCHERHSQGR